MESFREGERGGDGGGGGECEQWRWMGENIYARKGDRRLVMEGRKASEGVGKANE